MRTKCTKAAVFHLSFFFYVHKNAVFVIFICLCAFCAFYAKQTTFFLLDVFIRIKMLSFLFAYVRFVPFVCVESFRKRHKNHIIASFSILLPWWNFRKIHTYLRIFRVLGQFRVMVKSPQMMGMNIQKVLQNLHIHILHPNWSLSNS